LLQGDVLEQGEVAAGQSVIITRTNPRSDQLYFLFKGVAHQFMMNPLSFLCKTGLWGRNLVMLRDPSCGLYHGMLAEDLRGFASILARLREYRRQYEGCRKMHCAGTSAGAHAAILFGHYLEADVVTAFAPPSLIDADAMRAKRSLPASWTLPEEHRDLARLLATWNGRTAYRLFYCRSCLADKEQAERLAHCPGVSLHPQEGHQHNVVEVLDKNGKLGGLFPPSIKEEVRLVR
jgi:hypothetical protein